MNTKNIFLKILKSVLILSTLFALSCTTSANYSDEFSASKTQITISATAASQGAKAQNTVYAKNLIIVATEDECKNVVEHFLLKEFAKGFYYDANNNSLALVHTGIGGKAVNEALENLSLAKDVRIFNVGYCGSNTLKIGKVVKVSTVFKNEDHSKKIALSKDGLECYSADKFVTETKITQPCVFDMELFYIAKKFPNVVSYKIVSDNLSHDQYEKISVPDSWKAFYKELDAQLLK